MTNDNGHTKQEFRNLCAMLTRHAHHIEYSANGQLAKIDVAGAFIATGAQLLIDIGQRERAAAYLGQLLIELAGDSPAAPPAGRAA